MDSGEQGIDADIREDDADEPDGGEQGRTLALPVAGQAQMQINGVDDPGD